LIRDLSTGSERALARALRGPGWSPDGRSVVGASPAGQAWRCPREPGDCAELGAASSARWAPDGREILLRRLAAPLDDPQASAIQIVAVPAGGGPERQVATLGPMRNWCRGYSMAPDGAIAWVAYRAGRQELWSASLDPLP